MKQLIISIFVLLSFSSANAQKGDLIINSNLLGALESRQTVWLGIEKYRSSSSRVIFDIGYSYSRLLSNNNTLLPLDKSGINLKADFSLIKDLNSDNSKRSSLFHGINFGAKRLKYAGNVSVPESWELREGGLLISDYYSLSSSQGVYQEVNQVAAAIQYVFGYKIIYGRFSIDLFSQTGIEFTKNNMIVGERGVQKPEEVNRPKLVNERIQYSRLDLDLGVKVGYLLRTGTK